MAGIGTTGTSPNGVVWEELSEGSAQGDDQTKTRVFLIDTANLKTFLLELEGQWIKLSNANFFYTYPDQHCDFPNFFCQKTSHEGLGSFTVGTSNQIVRAKTKVTAEYSPLKFDANSLVNNIFTQELDWAAEVVSIPGGSFQTSSGKVIQDPIQKVIGCCEYTLTIEGQPDLPGGDNSVVQNALASPVNSTPILGAAIKRVLYKGERQTRSVTNQGAKQWKRIVRFAYRSIEWTKVWSKADGDWVEVTSVNGGNAIYTTSDLNLLLPH